MFKDFLIALWVPRIYLVRTLETGVILSCFFNKEKAIEYSIEQDKSKVWIEPVKII
jgi:hypothetical protein